MIRWRWGWVWRCIGCMWRLFPSRQLLISICIHLSNQRTLLNHLRDCLRCKFVVITCRIGRFDRVHIAGRVTKVRINGDMTNRLLVWCLNECSHCTHWTWCQLRYRLVTIWYAILLLYTSCWIACLTVKIDAFKGLLDGIRFNRPFCVVSIWPFYSSLKEYKF